MNGSLTSKGKGKERENQLSGDEEEYRGRRYPLSAPDYRNGQSSSSSSSRLASQSAYPLSTRSNGRWRLDLAHLSPGSANKRRILHFVLALSIPVLGLMLANEIRISNNRSRLFGLAPMESRTSEWEAIDLDSSPHSLSERRKAYEKKRRREIEQERTWQGSPLPLLPSPDGPEWTVDDEHGLKEEVDDFWPGWWGSRDVVGPSPYDHTPKAGHGERKRVLFLTSKRSLCVAIHRPMAEKQATTTTSTG